MNTSFVFAVVARCGRGAQFLSWRYVDLRVAGVYAWYFFLRHHRHHHQQQQNLASNIPTYVMLYDAGEHSSKNR